MYFHKNKTQYLRLRLYEWAARIILKDYVGGRLLYCEAPPGVNQEEFHKFDFEAKRIWKDEADQIAEARRLQQQQNGHGH